MPTTYDDSAATRLNTLYKKYLGFPNTNNNTTSVATEYSASALPFTYPNRVATQPIPSKGIPDAQIFDTIKFRSDNNIQYIGNTNILPSNSNNVILNQFSVDPSNSFKVCYYTNNTSPTIVCKWIDNIHLKYYSQLKLQPIPTLDDTSFTYIDSCGNTLLSRALLPTLSSDVNKYFITLNKLSSGSLIPITQSDYIFDRDAGTITMINTSHVSKNNPPYISFWRYEGDTLDTHKFFEPSMLIPNGFNQGDIIYAAGNNAISSESNLHYDIEGDTLYVTKKAVLTQYNGGKVASEWVFKNLIDAPPAPTLDSSGISSSTITCKWVNPTREMWGFSNVLVPVVNEMYIDISGISNGIPTRLSNFPLNLGGGLNIIDPSGKLLCNTLNIIKTASSNSFTSKDSSGNTGYNLYIGTGTDSKYEKYNVSIWYINNSSSKYTLDFNDLSFTAAGAVTTPTNITFTPLQTSATFSTNVNGLKADTTNNTVEFKSFDIKVAQKSTYRYNNSNSTIINASGGTISSNIISGTISGLTAGTTYGDVSGRLWNTLGNSSNWVLIPDSSGGTFTTSPPSPPTNSYINNKLTNPINSNILNKYNQGKNNIVTNPSDIINVNGSGTNSIADILLHKTSDTYGTQTADTLFSRFSFIIKDDNNNQVGSTGYIQYKASSAITSNISGTCTAGGNIYLDLSGTTPVDGNPTGDTNYFLKSTISYAIKSGLTPGNKYTLTIQQQDSRNNLVNTTTISSINGVFYVDDINPSVSPSFKSMPIITNTSTMTNVCGVPICNGNWSIKIRDVKTSNHISNFYPSRFLTYTFANTTTEADLLTAYSVTGSSGENVLIGNTDASGKVVSGSNDEQLRYPGHTSNTTVTLKAYSINKDNKYNNTTYTPSPVPIIISKATIDLHAYITTAGPVANGTTPGQRMKTITANNKDIRTLSTLEYTDASDNFNDFATCRTPFDNNLDISGATFAPGNGYCELQMINGLFMTPAFSGTGSDIAYKDYTNIAGVKICDYDYSKISSEMGYRWATFRWKVDAYPSGYNNCLFKINGIIANSTISIDNNYFRTTIDNKPIKLFYRVEDNSGTKSTDPTNLQGSITSVSNPGGISTVWVTTYQNKGEGFGDIATLYINNGTLNGGRTDVNIPGTSTTLPILSNGTIQYNVLIPAISVSAYIYFMIGLPVKADIAFRDVTCTLS